MILLLAAIWVGLTLAEKRAERQQMQKEDLNNLVFYGLVAFVVGGRLSFVLQNLPAFVKSPIGIISINPDLFDSLGGAAAALLAAGVYGQRRGLKLWQTLDGLTPFFAAAAVGVGLSHLATGTAFGMETSLPWGIQLWNATRHPSQMYETLAALGIFGVTWGMKGDGKAGTGFLTFAGLSAMARLFLEGFRGDSSLMLHGVRQAQVAAWLMLAGVMLVYELRLRRGKDG